MTAGKEDGGGENGTFNQMLVELELNDIAYHVYTDYAEVKRDWDSGELNDWRMEQCHLSALADVADTDVTWAQ